MYKIVSDKSANVVETIVSELVAEGWSTIGGVQVVYDSSRTAGCLTYHQALVKFDGDTINVDATPGAREFALEVFGEFYSNGVLGLLCSIHGRRVTKSDVRSFFLNAQASVENIEKEEA